MTKTKLQIIFEDQDLLVINKPVGLVVNNSKTVRDETLQDLVSSTFTVPKDDSEFSSRGGIVHRLDRDTSGLILVAKNHETFGYLKNQFKNRQIEKHYYAVVVGELKDSVIEINAPIKRNPTNRVKFIIMDDGREALTMVNKVNTVEGYTLVDVTPKTGRTHQIRVHLSALGFPIAADRIYCSRLIYSSSFEKFGRLMLHAYSIRFRHPKSEKEMYFECLPKEKAWLMFIPVK